VLTAGVTPKIDLSTWTLRFTGLVEGPLELTHTQFLALPRKRVSADFHCVTGWSRLDNEWEGVGFRELMGRVRPKPEARYVMVLCYGGYTTNLPLEALLDDDTLLALRHNGEDLTPEHGWPLRLVVPKRYSWKSAKWVREFDFMDEDEPGFWEVRGYHNDGDPWREERLSY
ncbi:MAG: molybdopterin-dependent oxidoreductase, partial [Dehalococcoidia bacterium]